MSDTQDNRFGNRFEGDAAGVFQMRDVTGGVHIHQEPPRRRVAPARQLQPPPGHYTNNKPQLDALSRVLGFQDDVDGPLVAIIRGEPGSGRSTLANAWLYHHGADFPDGQFLIRLAGGAADGEQVRVKLAELLGTVGFDPDQIPASLDGRSAMWRSWSTGRRIAMIVDDAVTAAQVAALLPGTSRSVVLAVEAGRLGGLMARASAGYVDIDPLSEESATLLLRRIVGQRRIDAEPDAVRALVGRCRGLAAALWVVGVQLVEFDDDPIAILADRLADDERALRELSRDPDLSLTVVFDAAYRRLGPLAQACYRLLGVHPGGGDVALATIAAVLGEPADDVAAALRALRRAMLVTRPTDDRYLMVGLLAAHARDKAGAQAGALRRRIIAHYRERALAASLAWLPQRGWLQLLWPELTTLAEHPGLTGDEARVWLAAERANLRAVVECAPEPVWTCQMAIALWPLHDQGKHAYDMATVNRLGADAARELGDALAESVIECQRGFAYRQLEDLDRAAELFEVARSAADRARSQPALGTAIEALALARLDQGRLADAEELLRENLEIAEEINEPRRLALARFHLAKVVSPTEAGELLASARRYFESSPTPEDYNLVKVDLWRAIKLAEDGQLDPAAGLLGDVSARAEAGGWHFERAQASEALADVAVRRGDLAVARAHLKDALDVYETRGFSARAVAVQHRLSELD
ncbi:MAG TPA: hypothetical protein VF444_11015 [Pseudonocardiaceae bacterium]